MVAVSWLERGIRCTLTFSRKTQVRVPFHTAVYKQGSGDTPTQPWILGLSFSQLVFPQCSSPPWVCKDLQPHQSWWNAFNACTDVRYTVAFHPWLLFAHNQWDELKLLFQLTKDHPRCYDAEIQHQMYSEPVNKLYLLFLMPFLQEFNRINKLFQQDRGNPFKMLECLLLFFRSLISRVMRPGIIPASDEQLLAINRPQCFVTCGRSQLWGHLHDALLFGSPHSPQLNERMVTFLFRTSFFCLFLLFVLFHYVLVWMWAIKNVWM